MLTQTLRSLERDGLAARTVTASVPVRVDYEPTDLGRSLSGLLSAVKDWAETHIEQVNAARDRYDEAGSRGNGTHADSGTLLHALDARRPSRGSACRRTTKKGFCLLHRRAIG